MHTLNVIKRNRYQDSVTLMQASVRLRALPGVADASLMMGTAPNKEILDEAGLLSADGQAAGPNDLIVALCGDQADVEQAAAQVEDLLKGEVTSGSRSVEEEPHNLWQAKQRLERANLALISTPGMYAAAEARKALLIGMHAMVFSDNVTIEDEIELKTLAAGRGLLMMGPDCGTAIIGGMPLGFANAVRRGPIGVVGASGTGMQEVTTLIDSYGSGVSHAIGTGSHDLSAHVGGIMTIMGLQALLGDPATDMIVIVSKPPDAATAERVEDVARKATKPVVIAFLGSDPERLVARDDSSNLVIATTLEEAALRAVELVSGTVPQEARSSYEESELSGEGLAPPQRYVRGLFSGGTFCYEAMLVLQDELGPIYSNTPLLPDLSLPAANHSREHTCLDLGADEFTVGRPHPMIDLSTRAQRIIEEARDPEVAVVLLDIVLGYGAHPDPAGELAPVITQAKALTSSEGRDLRFVASVCGTERDPQNLSAQENALHAAGVILAPSNAAAARIAATIASRAAVPSAR